MLIEEQAHCPGARGRGDSLSLKSPPSSCSKRVPVLLGLKRKRLCPRRH